LFFEYDIHPRYEVEKKIDTTYSYDMYDLQKHRVTIDLGHCRIRIQL
jgi:hypothetical protein